MSETVAEVTPAAATATEVTVPAQETTDWKAEARKWEDRAKTNSSAATKLAEIDAASLTEAQKLTARADAAEAKVAKFESDAQVAAWRAEVATSTGIPADALRGSTKDELEAHAALLAPLIAPKGPSGAVGPYVPPEGGAPRGALGDPATQFAEFIRNARGQ